MQEPIFFFVSNSQYKMQEHPMLKIKLPQDKSSINKTQIKYHESRTKIQDSRLKIINH